MVDKLTKISHFIPIKDTYEVVDVAQVFINGIIRSDVLGLEFDYLRDCSKVFCFSRIGSLFLMGWQHYPFNHRPRAQGRDMITLMNPLAPPMGVRGQCPLS